jgi:hypothetical protein
MSAAKRASLLGSIGLMRVPVDGARHVAIRSTGAGSRCARDGVTVVTGAVTGSGRLRVRTWSAPRPPSRTGRAPRRPGRACDARAGAQSGAGCSIRGVVADSSTSSPSKPGALSTATIESEKRGDHFEAPRRRYAGIGVSPADRRCPYKFLRSAPRRLRSRPTCLVAESGSTTTPPRTPCALSPCCVLEGTTFRP